MADRTPLQILVSYVRSLFEMESDMAEPEVMNFDTGMERVGEKFAALNPNSAFDWTTLVGILAEVLLPMIQKCMDRRATNSSRLAARTRRWGLREGAATRIALRQHPHFEGNEELISKVVTSLKDASEASTASELREFFESAGE